MNRYRVGGTMTISVFVDVDAETPEEAREKATEMPIRNLCHSCASNSEGEWSTSGELDGDPKIDPGEAVIELDADAKKRRR